MSEEPFFRDESHINLSSTDRAKVQNRTRPLNRETSLSILRDLQRVTINVPSDMCVQQNENKQKTQKHLAHPRSLARVFAVRYPLLFTWRQQRLSSDCKLIDLSIRWQLFFIIIIILFHFTLFFSYFCSPFLQGRQLLWLCVCFPAYQIAYLLKKGLL